jgi:hypothetical protein
MSAPLFVQEHLSPAVRIGRPFSATADAATDRVTIASHGFIAGSQLRLLSGTAPAGLTVGVTYFVVNPTTNDFQLALTLGGAPIDLTTAGANLIFKPHNTALDGSGHLRELLVAQPLTTPYARAVRFDLVRVKALEATAIGMIRLFKRDRTNAIFFLTEAPVTAIGTVGTALAAGTRSFEVDIPITGGTTLEPGEALLVSTDQPQTFDIIALQAGRLS